MIERNTIYNEDCFVTLDNMVKEQFKVDIVLTSPPYNNSRSDVEDRSTDTYSNRYDIYTDSKTEKEYCQWTVDLFNKFDKILVENGTVLYNVSYGNEAPNTLWLMIADVINRTPFMIADVISWKKNSALPQNISPNKLTRICEFVFVLCRKSEYMTYTANKIVTSVRETGQKMYGVVYNYISAPNNDGSCTLNKATYSTKLCTDLLTIYAKDNSTVYDPFMGTGTTAVACRQLGHNYVGSELSPNQCEYANNRIFGVTKIEQKQITVEELF